MNLNALRSTLALVVAMAAVAVMAAVATPWLSMPPSSPSLGLGLGYGYQLDSNAFVVNRLELASPTRNTASYVDTVEQESLPAYTRYLRCRILAFVRAYSTVYVFASELASLAPYTSSMYTPELASFMRSTSLVLNRVELASFVPHTASLSPRFVALLSAYGAVHVNMHEVARSVHYAWNVNRVELASLVRSTSVVLDGPEVASFTRPTWTLLGLGLASFAAPSASPVHTSELASLTVYTRCIKVLEVASFAHLRATPVNRPEVALVPRPTAYLRLAERGPWPIPQACGERCGRIDPHGAKATITDHHVPALDHHSSSTQRTRPTLTSTRSTRGDIRSTVALSRSGLTHTRSALTRYESTSLGSRILRCIHRRARCFISSNMRGLAPHVLHVETRVANFLRQNSSEAGPCKMRESVHVATEGPDALVRADVRRVIRTSVGSTIQCILREHRSNTGRLSTRCISRGFDALEYGSFREERASLWCSGIRSAAAESRTRGERSPLCRARS